MLLETLLCVPERRLSLQDVRRAANNGGLFAPTTKWEDTAASTAKEDEDPSFVEREMLNQSSLNNELQEQIERTLAPKKDDMVMTTPFPDARTSRVTSEVQHPDFSPKGNINQAEFKEADSSAELIEQLIEAIQSELTTQEEQALGFFTQKKSKKLAKQDPI